MKTAESALDNHSGSEIRVLAIMPSAQDHETLDRMLPQTGWHMNRANTVSAAIKQLGKQKEIPALILCDRDSGGWKEILSCVQDMSRPPLLIITSRLADEQLWAEALNLGAYDVLAKPFEEAEVRRTVSSACRRWRMAECPQAAY